MAIRGKTTTHDGTTFRSILEARWSVYLRALGIGWEYEQVTFRYGKTRYTPDFRLAGLPIYLEVKPLGTTRINPGAVMLAECGVLANPLIVVIGPPQQYRTIILARSPSDPDAIEPLPRGLRYPSFRIAFHRACLEVQRCR